jgi:hypothetical protein
MGAWDSLAKRVGPKIFLGKKKFVGVESVGP